MTTESITDGNMISVGPVNLLGDFVVHGEGDLELIRLHADGSVTGEIENAGEAGRVFIDYIRAHWGGR